MRGDSFWAGFGGLTTLGNLLLTPFDVALCHEPPSCAAPAVVDPTNEEW